MSTNAAAPFWAMIPVLALASAGFVPPAGAADDLDPVVAEVLSAWSGFHIGIGGGYGAALHEGPGEVDGGWTFDGSGDRGGLVTFEAGLDFQLDERLVLGILGDYTRVAGVELENMETVAARLGFLSSPQTLWYGLAGWTHAGVDAAGEDVDLDGISIGAGAESMLTEALSWKLEYRYTDTTVQSIRGVLSWRFNLHCKIHDCAQGSRSGTLTPPLSSGQEKELPSGCKRVLRAPAKYSRETVAICEIANSL